MFSGGFAAWLAALVEDRGIRVNSMNWLLVNLAIITKSQPVLSSVSSGGYAE